MPCLYCAWNILCAGKNASVGENGKNDRQKKTGDLGGGSRSKRFEERGDNRAASGGYGNPAHGEDRALQVLLCQYSFGVSLGID
jgi:hypothetical protein